ncbi:MAG TPA: hypothetical protein VKU41_14590 [Polyangiaceae bacterium]|nr:hypothetical protein [Polyangiaceae bacterium]
MKKVPFAILATGFALASPAWADPSPPPPDAEGARLERSLDQYAEEAHRSRLTGIGWGVAEGAVLVPVGIYLATRSDERNLVGTGLIVEGSMALYEVPSLFWRGSMEKLRDRLVKRRASGLSAAVAAQLTETEWGEAALQDRKYRPFWGIAGLVAGGVVFGVGATALLAPPVLGFDRHVQDTWGAILLPIGLRALYEGASLAFARTELERAWDLYQRSDPRVGGVARVAPVFAVAPASGGAVASLGLAF